jgi:GABA(A) receptor-associated protein
MFGYQFKFKNLSTFEKRKEESTRIISKFPDKIPVICEPYDNDLGLDKTKYLVPNDLTMGHFVYVIRKRCSLSPEKSLFLLINNKHIPPTSQLISEIYNQLADEDGFLYIVARKEETFG